MTLLVNYKESALILEESPIQQKYKQGTEGNLYQVGCSSVCLYKRLAMLSSMHRWQSHFLYKSSKAKTKQVFKKLLAEALPLLIDPKNGLIKKPELSPADLGGFNSILKQL